MAPKNKARSSDRAERTAARTPAVPRRQPSQLPGHRRGQGCERCRPAEVQPQAEKTQAARLTFVAAACEAYFLQSEQLPTLIRVGARHDARGCIAGGLLIQHLPDGEEKLAVYPRVQDEIRRFVETLPDALTAKQ